MLPTFVLALSLALQTLIFSLAALAAGQLTVVFSPLVSLIQDQVNTLTLQSIPAVALTSATDAEEVPRIWAKVFSGETRMLYITPERFAASTTLTAKLTSLYNQGRLTAFVIDEGQPSRRMRI